MRARRVALATRELSSAVQSYGMTELEARARPRALWRTRAPAPLTVPVASARARAHAHANVYARADNSDGQGTCFGYIKTHPPKTPCENAYILM